MIIVSRKPIMAGYQFLVFKILYIYVMLICDTLINYYLLTYLLYYSSISLLRMIRNNIRVIHAKLCYGLPFSVFFISFLLSRTLSNFILRVMYLFSLFITKRQYNLFIYSLIYLFIYLL